MIAAFSKQSRIKKNRSRKENIKKKKRLIVYRKPTDYKRISPKYINLISGVIEYRHVLYGTANVLYLQ